MKIRIDDKKRISTIQKKFNAAYPHLSLEFFTRVHGRGESSVWDDHLDSHKTLGEFRHKHFAGDLDILPEMTVAVLEETLHRKFGLFVQVFRKSGDVWLETTVTDGWTLERQESEATFWALHLNTEQ